MDPSPVHCPYPQGDTVPVLAFAVDAELWHVEFRPQAGACVSGFSLRALHIVTDDFHKEIGYWDPWAA